MKNLELVLLRFLNKTYMSNWFVFSGEPPKSETLIAKKDKIFSLSTILSFFLILSIER